LTATCPVGTVVAGCGIFQNNSTTIPVSSPCADGSVGVSDIYINGANGCSGQAYNNSPHGICTPYTATVTVQARCINVP
jgi:hypothetical protein